MLDPLLELNNWPVYYMTASVVKIKLQMLHFVVS